jgi:hypothetical protein
MPSFYGFDTFRVCNTPRWDLALVSRRRTGRQAPGAFPLMITPSPRKGRMTMFGTDTNGWPSFRVAAIGVLCAGRLRDVSEPHSRRKLTGAARTIWPVGFRFSETRLACFVSKQPLYDASEYSQNK